MNFQANLSIHLPTSDVQKMVDFYQTLGFSLIGELGVRGGGPVFARMALGSQQLRIEQWHIPEWDIPRKGFAITTLWFETDAIEAVAEHLREAGIPFDGPSEEDYGTTEIELFDPVGFRIIFAQNTS
jgi:catechol 2,3-dioxygenase-like lactoylglutathione lyase family enzyme